jgi:transposase InsO family protein
MDQRVELIADWRKKDYSIVELGRIYGVSRKTIYKWLDRYQSEQLDGLKERDRAPLNHPNATPYEVVDMIVKAKLTHQRWGPKKLLARLQREHEDTRWPALSTMSEILKRHGLVKPRHPHHHTPPYTEPFHLCREPNAVWSADYKGQFRLGNGHLCFPLTISDNFSRYLLGCRALGHPSYAETQPWFERTFREYGLPGAIRTDNGAPFASVSVGGLSRLSVWWIKLGIIPERIEPGEPQQNGRHERMHRTLKEATVTPPRDNLTQQQRAFDRFLSEFNHERPHESLGQRTPVSVHRRSPRDYPSKLAKVEYDTGTLVRHIHTCGCMKWQGKLIYVSENLSGEDIGLKRISEHEWEMRFSFHYLGIFDENNNKINTMNTMKSVTHVPG